MDEWICETCIHYPPSSLNGKPCAMCDPDEPMLNCYCADIMDTLAVHDDLKAKLSRIKK